MFLFGISMINVNWKEEQFSKSRASEGKKKKGTNVYGERNEFSTKHFQKISSLGAPSKRVSATI